ncbi:MAG: hypothetical protein IKP49_05515 [Treponema sp.]|nr:hypothetical protein [Treponema sp.]
MRFFGKNCFVFIVFLLCKSLSLFAAEYNYAGDITLNEDTPVDTFKPTFEDGDVITFDGSVNITADDSWDKPLIRIADDDINIVIQGTNNATLTLENSDEGIFNLMCIEDWENVTITIKDITIKSGDKKKSCPVVTLIGETTNCTVIFDSVQFDNWKGNVFQADEDSVDCKIYCKNCVFNCTKTALLANAKDDPIVAENCTFNNCNIAARIGAESLGTETISLVNCTINSGSRTDKDIVFKETGTINLAGTTAGTVELCEDAVFTVLKSGDTYQRLKDDYTTETVTVGTDWTGTAEVSFASGAEPTTSKPVVNITTTGSGNKLPTSSIPYFEKQVFLKDKTGKYAIRKNKDGTLQAAVHSTSW